MPFCSVEEAIEELKKGNFIIVLDDESRENEGDLIIAAEKVTPEAINFMARYARGLVCMPMTAERLGEIDLSLMTAHNTEAMGTASSTAGMWHDWQLCRSLKSLCSHSW